MSQLEEYSFNLRINLVSGFFATHWIKFTTQSFIHLSLLKKMTVTCFDTSSRQLWLQQIVCVAFGDVPSCFNCEHSYLIWSVYCFVNIFINMSHSPVRDISVPSYLSCILEPCHSIVLWHVSNSVVHPTTSSKRPAKLFRTMLSLPAKRVYNSPSSLVVTTMEAGRLGPMLLTARTATS